MSKSHPRNSPFAKLWKGVVPPTAEDLHWFRNKFKPTFNTMVMDPINRLVPSQDALIGFIFMSCAIDYLAGFWWGDSTKGKVGVIFTKFVDTYFVPNKYNSIDLYDSLRNGLVHMFTIKGKKYALVHNNQIAHLKMSEDEHVMLNAENFRDDIIVAKELYFKDVEEDSFCMDKLKERYIRDGFLEVLHVSVKL
jgi:hypothetical protein